MQKKGLQRLQGLQGLQGLQRPQSPGLGLGQTRRSGEILIDVTVPTVLVVLAVLAVPAVLSSVPR